MSKTRSKCSNIWTRARSGRAWWRSKPWTVCAKPSFTGTRSAARFAGHGAKRRMHRRGGGDVATPYKIHLDTYDGPLDLLLDLIRKQEMDIHNIPIARITGQYLEYLHKLEKLDIDVSADFIYMAATLILIKSKMLLPADPLAGPEEQIDPRAALVHRLVEHEQFKSAAQLLYQNQQLEPHAGPKPARPLKEAEEGRAELVVSRGALVAGFRQ